MLTEQQLERLNVHVAMEAQVSRFYLSVSCWAIFNGMPGVGAFFRGHHELEEEHMHRLMAYILEVGGKVDVGPIEAPQRDFESVSEALRLYFDKERVVSRKINDTVDAFLAEKDHSTCNFLQWYVAEQHEEENLFQTLIDKVELIGDEGRGRFWIDKELEQAAQQAAPPA